jgi:DNA-binding NtrC family response regulator
MRQSPTRPSHLATTALIVDDDRSVREVLGRWLAESGVDVVACGSFEEAKAHLARHTPDVLVTDIRLQGYNGLQLVMEMREKRPTAPCLVITGHDDPVLRKEAEHMRARYLLKPFERDDFLAAVEGVSTFTTH